MITEVVKIVEKPVIVEKEKIVYRDVIVEKPIETTIVREVEKLVQIPVEVIKFVEVEK